MQDTEVASRLACSATRQYVKENYPDYEEYFDRIWRLSNLKSGTNVETPSELEPTHGGVSFVNDEVVVQIAQVLIPFFSGVFSSVLADIVRDRILSRKETTLRINAEGERIRVALRLDKRITKKLLPLVFTEIEKEVKKRGQKKRKSKRAGSSAL